MSDNKINGKYTGKKLRIKSIKYTQGQGGVRVLKAQSRIGQIFTIEDHIPDGSIPGFTVGADIFEVHIDNESFFLHADDIEIIEETGDLWPRDFELDFESYEPPPLPGQCCDNPDIIENQVLGQKFFVCRNCKKEVDSEK